MRKAMDEHLSNSILHVESSRMLATKLLPVMEEELRQLSSGWAFDWVSESRKFKVFKLITLENPSRIEGLVSLEMQKGFCLVSLVESVPHNLNKGKLHEGVGGNLFAFACAFSIEHGSGGYVCFESKTALKDYYEKNFGARQVGNSNRMYIDEVAAKRLVDVYFTQKS